MSKKAIYDALSQNKVQDKIISWHLPNAGQEIDLEKVAEFSKKNSKTFMKHFKKVISLDDARI